GQQTARVLANVAGRPQPVRPDDARERAGTRRDRARGRSRDGRHFHEALLFEQEFEVAIRITDIAPRTISYACDMTQNGRRIATGTMKIACVRKSREGMRSIQIPADIAARFSS